jgi:5-methylthioadenosine/S-adenosylhomocysteine deaminase
MMLEIRGGIIIPVNPSGKVIHDGIIRIEAGRITDVGPGDQAPAQGAEVIDAKNCLILPGLINAHTHAAMTLLRSYADDLPLMEWLQQKIWPAEARLTAKDIYWGTRLAIQEMALGGITTFVDMYDFMDEVARAVEETGIRGVLSRGIIGVTPDSEAKLKAGVDLCQRWEGKADGRITTMMGPHAPYTCPPEFFKDILAAARELNTGIHIHIAETEAENQQMLEMYGKRPFEYLADLGLLDFRVIAAHGVWFNEAELAEIAKHEWGIAHNPVSNLKLGSGVALVPEMLRLGIPVGLGTDGASSNNRLDIWSEMKTAAILHKGVTRNPEVIPAVTALEMATLGGARAIGLAGEIGSLEPGKKADLIMIDLNKSHLAPVYDLISLAVYVVEQGDVSDVMVDGKWIVRHGQFLPFEIHEAMAACRKIGSKFLA